MSDLRAVVEVAHKERHPGHPSLRVCEYKGCTFRWAAALIPEGAVLVTVEGLATELELGGYLNGSWESHQVEAATRILARLRETP